MALIELASVGAAIVVAVAPAPAAAPGLAAATAARPVQAAQPVASAAQRPPTRRASAAPASPAAQNADGDRFLYDSCGCIGH